MIEITDSAKFELTKLLETEQALNKHLIIYFQGFGWAGPSLGMTLDESSEDMIKYSSNSIDTYMESKLSEYLKQFGKIVIDFMKTGNGGSYKIIVGSQACWDLLAGFLINPAKILSKSDKNILFNTLYYAN